MDGVSWREEYKVTRTGRTRTNKQNGAMAVKGRPLVVCRGPMTSTVYHQAPRQRNATNPSEPKGLDANLRFSRPDSVLLIVSLVKPLKYPLLASLLPAAQRDIHKARDAII